MAPEILSGTFGSTPTIYCDVYSFGLLVNELLDERIPYHERKDLTLKGLTEIVTKGEAQGVNRPILVSNKVAPTSFRDFIQKCWASKPLDRPTFEKMCDAKPQPWEEASTSHGAGGMSVNKELIDVFKDKNTLSLVEFGKKMVKILKLEGQLSMEDVGHVNTRALQAVFNCPNVQLNPIKREDVERFCSWIGGEKQILHYIYTLCCKPWFFGILEPKDVKEVLEREGNNASKTYLVHWDNNEHMWCLKYIEAGKIVPYNIQDSNNPQNKQISFLIAEVEKLVKEKGLKNPAKGRINLLSGVEMKEKFITGGSGGAYVMSNTGSQKEEKKEAESADLKTYSKHYTFVL